MTRRIAVHESVGQLFPSERLVAAFADLDATVVTVGNDPEALSALDVLVTLAYDETFLESDLGWVHSVQAGVDRFPFEAFEQRGIALTSSAGIHGDVVGETVVGYLLAFARGLHRYQRAQRERRWADPDWERLYTLRGERLCVVGLGTLGRGIATRANALGMDVVGVKRTPTPVDGVDRVYTVDDLHAAIAEATFVALAVPLTDRTRGSFDREAFEAMRTDAVLVNVARGPVVDEAALIDALRDGEIAGAALDVFETEPLPDDSPLWEMDEVIVTPHIAGAHEAYHERVAALVRENLRRRAADEPMANRVV